MRHILCSNQKGCQNYPKSPSDAYWSDTSQEHEPIGFGTNNQRHFFLSRNVIFNNGFFHSYHPQPQLNLHSKLMICLNSQFFLNVNISTSILTQLPKQLKQSLYGTRKAQQEFNTDLKKKLRSVGFSPSPDYHSLYTLRQG